MWRNRKDRAGESAPRGRTVRALTTVVALVGTIAVTSQLPAQPLAAVDALEFAGVKGVWSEVAGDTTAATSTNPPPCLAFGRDVSSVNGNFTAGQNTDPAQPTVRNQVRFGFPSGTSGDDCGSVDNRSGFGFSGVALPSTEGLFELGRFTHFNRPIRSNANNAGTAKLIATYRINDLTTNPPTLKTLPVEYTVDLDETPNNANPCKYVTGGDNVPPGVEVDNSQGCADRIQVSIANQSVTVDIGETSTTFAIGGFAPINANGTCNLGGQIQGNQLFTPEGGERQACIYGEAAKGTLVINKVVQGGGSGSFQFQRQEISQKFATKGAPVGSPVGTTVNVTNGTGTSGEIKLAPGLYNLTELTGSLGDDMEFVSVACTTNGTTATLPVFNGTGGTNATTGANVILDIDSNETVTCTYTNRRAAEITIVKDAQPNSTQPFSFSTSSPAAGPKFGVLPASFSLTDNGGPNSQTWKVQPGSYTVTEDPFGAGVFWELSAIACTLTPGAGSQGSTSTSVQNRTATLTNLSPGDKATCTFTNRQVPPPQIALTKTATPTSFQEVDGSSTYGVTVSNPGTEPVRITALSDVIVLRGSPGTQTTVNLLTATAPFAVPSVGGTIATNTCTALANQELAPGGNASCSFRIDYVGRNAGQILDDTVTVTGTDSFGRTVQASADASVTVTDRPPVMTVDKQNVETSVVAPGGLASYTVTVTNGPNAVEPITITEVVDQLLVDRAGAPVEFQNFGGPLAITTSPATAPVTATTCNTLIGTTLAIGASVSCTFTVDTTQIGSLFTGDTLRNLVTVTAVDDDGTTVTRNDDADRPVLVAPPLLDVFKTDLGAQITEPGTGANGQIIYTLQIDNRGLVGVNPPLTLTKIVDDVTFRLSDSDPIGPSIGTVVIELGADPVVSASFTKPGVSLVDQTCSSLLGTVLQPATGFTDIGGRQRPQNADARAECTITLQLPGNAGNQYDDTVVVTAVDPADNEVTAQNGANTPVVGVDPTVKIVKIADPTEVDEPGGTVTFTFTVTNTSVETDPVTITKLDDTVFGDLLAENRTDTNCRANLLGVTLQPATGDTPAESASCTLTAFVAGNVGETHENIATVTVVDDEGVAATDSDDATVTFRDVLPTIEVTKTAIDTNPDPLTEYGGDVTYEVVVTNTSVEPVWLTSLVDDTFGDLAGKGTCQVSTVTEPVVIAVGGSYTCTFTGFVVQEEPGQDAHVNVVTATAVDDEGNTAEASDDESVPLVLVPPKVSITKDDEGASVNEPGGTVTYFLTITNAGDEPIVAIDTLTDTITYVRPASEVTVDLLGDLTDVLVRNTCPDEIDEALPLDVGASFDCEFDVVLSGTAQLVTDVVTVIAVDDDGQTSEPATDDESTPILDVPPAVSITKTAEPTVIAPGGSTEYTFVITNESDAEPLYILGLTDDQFGDLAEACGFDVDPPVELAPKGQDGDSTTCTLTLTPDFPTDGADRGIHVNVATVSAADDEILEAMNDDDPETVGEPVTASDDETVYASSTITVKKLATPPGDSFDFTLSHGQSSTTKTATLDPDTGTYPVLVFSGLEQGSYDLTEDVPDGWDLTQIVCLRGSTPVPFPGVEDAAGVTIALGWGDAVDCTFKNTLLGDVTIAKSLISGPTQRPGTNVYDLVYEIVVTNNSYAAETFEVDDTLTVPAGATVTVGEITSDPDVDLADWAGSGPLTDGPQPIAGRTVEAPSTVVITVDVAVTLPGSTEVVPGSERCGAGRVRIVLNSVDLVGTESGDDTCDDLPDPSLDQTKTVVGTPTRDASGLWTVAYDLVVTNSGNGPGVYSVDDELRFGDGVEIQSVTVQVTSVGGQTSPAGPTDADVNPDFDGVDDTVLVTDVEIVGKVSHTYRITVTATIPSPVIGAGACDPDGSEAGGFLNVATLTANGVEQDPDPACAPFSTLTLTKTLNTTSGGNATLDDFVLTATPLGADDPVVSGTGSVSGAVEPGAYALAETQVPGYTSTGFSCGDVAVADSVVTVPAGADVSCTIVNDDEPVDLELTKSDGGITATAGGASFPYTLTVRNVGARDADLDEDVVVTDVLPSVLEWVTFPSDPLGDVVCSVAGQVLTCDVNPALLAAGAEPVVITLTVKARPDAPAGTYTNVAWVNTDDDPVCVGEDCPDVPPCPTPQAPNNNVDCEQTPVDGEAELDVTKTDDVTGTVVNGQQFTYTIVVTNLGPSQVSDVRIDDDLPTGLDLVSVTAGSGWTCNDTDPVACTYGPALAPGASTSSVVLTVEVRDDAVFDDDTIENTVVAKAVVSTLEGPETIEDTDDERTPLVPTIDVTGFLPDCAADYPVIRYEIVPLGFVPEDPTVSLTFFDAEMTPLWVLGDGSVVAAATQPANSERLVVTSGIDPVTLQPVSPLGLSGTVLFPGASIDPPDWPGWLLTDDGFWVIDPADAFLRDGVFISVSVNPEAMTALIEYPPASATCNAPPFDLEFEKSDNGAVPLPGQQFDYTLTVRNVGGSSSTEPVTVTDVLPAEFAWVSFPSDPLGSVVCSAAGQVLTCDVDPALLGAPTEPGEPGGNVSFTARAQVRPDTAVSGDGYVNVGWVDSPDDPVCPDGECPEVPECPSDTANGTLPNNNVDCEQTPVDGDATLTVTKTDSVPNSQVVVNGQTFTYTLTLRNNGPSPVRNVTLTDDLPNGLELVSVTPGAGWSCNAVDPVSCSRAGTLAAGATAPPVVLTVRVSMSFVGTSILNTAVGNAVVDTIAGPKPVTDSDDELTPLAPTLDVSAFTAICVADAPFIEYTIVPLGFVPSPVRATLTFFDVQGRQVGQPTIVNSLSGRVVYPGARVDENGRGIDWPGWRFVDGLWITDPSDAILRDGLTIRVDVNPTATASVSYPPATEACADPTQVSADLRIVKTSPSPTVQRGSTFDWTLTVTNDGPDPATGVVVTDVVPSPMLLTSATSSAFTCSTTGNTVRCTRPTLAVGASGTIRVTVRVPTDAPEGPVTNVAAVEAVTPDPDLGNNSDDDTVTVPPAVVLPPTPPPTQPPLPETGGDVRNVISLALLLLGAGLAARVSITKRKRQTAS